MSAAAKLIQYGRIVGEAAYCRMADGGIYNGPVYRDLGHYYVIYRNTPIEVTHDGEKWQRKTIQELGVLYNSLSVIASAIATRLREGRQYSEFITLQGEFDSTLAEIRSLENAVS